MQIITATEETTSVNNLKDSIQTSKAPETQIAPKKPKDLLTRREAAELLDCHEGTLAKWKSNKRNSLKYIKIGKNVRYRREDIMAFLEENINATAKEDAIIACGTKRPKK